LTSEKPRVGIRIGADVVREDQVEEGKPSATALFSAMLRAAHLLWDQPPKIFEDTLALQLSGFESEAALKAQMDHLEAEVWGTTNPDFALIARQSVRAAVITRSRYLEDEVDLAVRRAVSQYVILGAGLDSFAYRRPELAKVLHIFEVDHPATQAWKRARLRAAGVELPANLSLVAVDFERESLIDNLRMSG
jgi:methyltransferase (TIGR00027 family)